MKAEYLWDAVPNIAKRAFFQADAIYLNTQSSCKEDKKRSTIISYIFLHASLYKRLERFFKMIQNENMGVDFGDHIHNWQTKLSFEEISAIVSYIPVTTVDRRVEDLIDVEDCNNGQTCKGGFRRDNIIDNIQQNLDQHLEKDVFVEAYLRQAAVLMGKTVGSVETLTEECDVVKDKPSNFTLWSIENDLNTYERFNGDVAEYRKYANNVINHFRCGTRDYSFDSLLDEVKNDAGAQDNKLGEEYYTYLKEANKKINKIKADRIATLMESNNAKMFFVSAVAHFLGEKSIVQLLRENGFLVERLDALDHIYYY